MGNMSQKLLLNFPQLAVGSGSVKFVAPPAWKVLLAIAILAM